MKYDGYSRIQKCPKCRCTKSETTGNMVEYPDVWQKWNCVHCGFLVAQADNSPIRLCNEFEDNLINAD